MGNITFIHTKHGDSKSTYSSFSIGQKSNLYVDVNHFSHIGSEIHKKI